MSWGAWPALQLSLVHPSPAAPVVPGPPAEGPRGKGSETSSTTWEASWKRRTESGCLGGVEGADQFQARDRAGRDGH